MVCRRVEGRNPLFACSDAAALTGDHERLLAAGGDGSLSKPVPLALGQPVFGQGAVP